MPLPAYSASKAAIDAFVFSLRDQLRKRMRQKSCIQGLELLRVFCYVPRGTRLFTTVGHGILQNSHPPKISYMHDLCCILLPPKSKSLYHHVFLDYSVYSSKRNYRARRLTLRLDGSWECQRINSSIRLMQGLKEGRIKLWLEGSALQRVLVRIMILGDSLESPLRG